MAEYHYDANALPITVPDPQFFSTSTTGSHSTAELMELEPNTLYGCIFDAVTPMPDELARWNIRPNTAIPKVDYADLFYGPVYETSLYQGNNWVLRSRGSRYGYTVGDVFNYITLGHTSQQSIFVLGHSTKLIQQGTSDWSRPPLFFKITGVTKNTIPSQISLETPNLILTQSDVPMVPFQYCQAAGGTAGNAKN